MNNETRNELLQLLSLTEEIKKENGDIDFKVNWLLESFERQINNEIKEAKRIMAQAKENKELLEYVKEQIKNNGDK